jgi:hypothetical protein
LKGPAKRSLRQTGTAINWVSAGVCRIKIGERSAHRHLLVTDRYEAALEEKTA